MSITSYVIGTAINSHSTSECHERRSFLCVTNASDAQFSDNFEKLKVKKPLKYFLRLKNFSESARESPQQLVQGESALRGILYSKVRERKVHLLNAAATAATTVNRKKLWKSFSVKHNQKLGDKLGASSPLCKLVALQHRERIRWKKQTSFGYKFVYILVTEATEHIITMLGILKLGEDKKCE